MFSIDLEKNKELVHQYGGTSTGSNIQFMTVGWLKKGSLVKYPGFQSSIVYSSNKDMIEYETLLATDDLEIFKVYWTLHASFFTDIGRTALEKEERLPYNLVWEDDKGNVEELFLLHDADGNLSLQTYKRGIFTGVSSTPIER